MLCHQGEYLESGTRGIVQVDDGDTRAVIITGYTRNVQFFHVRTLLDFRTRIAGKARNDLEIDIVLLCHFNRAVVQDLCAERRKLEHFIIRDSVQLTRILDDTRVGGVYAVNVGVDLAEIRAERRRDGNCGGVRAAAAEGSHIAHLVDALETGNDNDAAVVQLCLEAVAGNALDACVRVVAVGLHADLPAGQGNDREAELLDSHSEQGHRDHLAGVEQHIHLASGRTLVQLGGLFDEVIGGVALSGNDDNDLVAGLSGAGYNVSDILQSLGISDRGAAELLHNKTHSCLISSLYHAPAEAGASPYANRKVFDA